MIYLQEFIHKLEVGPGLRYLKIGLACLALVTLTVGYNWRSFHNMNAPEAMDAAQVGRNLSRGQGYTTQFIRPLSLYLVKKRSESRFGIVPPNVDADYARIKDRHPDLANPPLYPCVLAIWMKIYPALLKVADGVRNFMPGFIKNRMPSFSASPDNRLWQNAGRFWWDPHDFFIAVLNEILFFTVIVLTFLLARRLFDSSVAWLSGILLLGSEWLWRFCVSGLSTMLLMLIFTGLVWCLVFVEREAREPRWGLRELLLLASAAGLLVGLGALTRYAFAFMIVPVMLFFIFFGGPRKAALCLMALALFVLLLTPWMYRNYRISGTPLGIATFSVLEGTTMYPENKLERALEPDFNRIYLAPFIHKLLGNSKQILQNDVPRLGSSWLTPLFLSGLLLGFRSLTIRRLRYFLVISLAMLVIVQAMGRTQLSEESPEFNSENLLAVLVPMIFVFGVSFFFLLLDQMKLLFRGLRYIVVGVFAFVMCLPMVFIFLPPKTTPVMYPPYYPPAIRQVCGWMRESELMMSDIPWAVAWYGDRQCTWTTLNAQDQFFALNDMYKPVRALYFTPQTMDSRFLTQWVRAGEHSWGSFILESMLRREIPPSFPLRKAPSGFLPEQLFLTDWDRWKAEPKVQTPTESAQPQPEKKK
jgi:hypothetical protein